MNIVFLEEAGGLPPVLFAVLAITVPIIILAIVVFVRLIVKNAKKDKAYRKYAGFDYQGYFGGESNIENVEVVMSRVNVTVKDLELVKLDELKNLGCGILVVGNVVKCANKDFAEKVESAISSE